MRRLQLGPDPRDAYGRRVCRWCNGLVVPPKRTFCSQACVYEWRLRSDVTFMRKELFKRDKGICAKCGLDTVAALKGRREGYPLLTEERRLTLPKGGRLTLWDADHIVEVAEGGGACGLYNLQTLCIWCHRVKTADFNRLRAKK